MKGKSMFVDGMDKGKERLERKKNEQETVRKRDRQTERLTDKHSSSSWILMSTTLGHLSLVQLESSSSKTHFKHLLIKFCKTAHVRSKQSTPKNKYKTKHPYRNMKVKAQLFRYGHSETDA